MQLVGIPGALEETIAPSYMDLRNICPQVHPPISQWSLRIVLHQLINPPFESLTKVPDRLLPLKTIFLVAITSARCAGELTALRVDPPYLQFHPNK
ncbi:hypothetical protein JRQ81_011244, partial [Phrynocephalus forsythii]